MFIFHTNILNACDEDPKNSYILKTGRGAEQALEEQHKIFEQDSYEHLKRAGLSSGHTVWDIGCGSGVMTEYLAKTVGSTGHVYAFDINLTRVMFKRRVKKFKVLKTLEYHFGY
ncbi:MAG: methyltransferase domain-containing protein [Janthinobacterium lividum]